MACGRINQKRAQSLLHTLDSRWPLKARKTLTNTVTSAGSNRLRADAARYNIMWRLVPSVNHKLAGSMQPITMLAGMLARHLQRAQPDPHVLIKLAADMQQTCKAAVTTRADVLAWFQPSESQRVSVEIEVAHCTSMLTAEFAIQGCSIDNQVASQPTNLQQAHVRTLFTAALFAILDNAPGPVAVQVRALPASSHRTTIVLSWTDMAASELRPLRDASHAIKWDDVQAIADQMGVPVRCTANQCDMHFASEG